MYATVDVLESYTIVNCFFLAKYDHISCQVEYSHDCNRLSNSKRRSVVNASDVSILLESISPSTVYCFVLTADNQSHTVKVQGNFSGLLLVRRVLTVRTSPAYRIQSTEQRVQLQQQLWQQLQQQLQQQLRQQLQQQLWQQLRQHPQHKLNCHHGCHHPNGFSRSDNTRCNYNSVVQEKEQLNKK